MEVKLIEKLVIVPEKPTERRRMFLSSIDLSLVKDENTVSFLDPLTTNNISFSEICSLLSKALSCLLVPYDFVAGRLVPALGEKKRLEIDCNGAGVVFTAARTEASLSQLGQLLLPKPDYKNLLCFLYDDDEEQMKLEDKPLMNIQVTQFRCQSLAIGVRYNHCILDGIAWSQFKANLVALIVGDGLVIEPKSDRIFLRERNPPIINRPHLEYSASYAAVTQGLENGANEDTRAHLIYLSPERISSLKKAVLEDGKLKSCTTFQVVVARIWKAWTIVLKMKDEITSTLLLPINFRDIINPKAPSGFAGNAVAVSYAQARIKEMKENGESSYLVAKVQEGIQRMDDDYVRSEIDWLKVHGGRPAVENSLTVVAWWKLGLEDKVPGFIRLKGTAPIAVNPGVIYLLPDLHGEGGVNVCLQMADAEIKEFTRLTVES